MRQIVKLEHLAAILVLASCQKKAQEPSEATRAAISESSPEALAARPVTPEAPDGDTRADKKPAYDKTWCSEPCRLLSQVPLAELKGAEVSALCGRPLELSVTGCESIDFFRACIAAQTGAEVDPRYLANFELEAWFGAPLPQFDPKIVSANRRSLVELRSRCDDATAAHIEADTDFVREWFSVDVSKRLLPARVRLDEDIVEQERVRSILAFPAYQLTPKTTFAYHRAPLEKGQPRTIAAVTTCDTCEGEQYIEFELSGDGTLLGLNVHSGVME